MAPEEPLAYPGIIGEDHPDSQVPLSPSVVVVTGGKRPFRPTLAPLHHAVQIFTDAPNGWDTHLGD